MYILSFFNDDGVPKTGLTPTIKIRDVSNGSLLINGASMTEVGDGFYRYDYVAYDTTKDYAIVCDGGVSLSDSERYVYAGNESYVEDVADGVWNENLVNKITPNSAATAVKAATYENVITLDTVGGVSGTGWPIGTGYKPSNNLTDALTIMLYGNINELVLLSDLTIEAGHDVSDKVIKTIGKMGTDITFEAGCSANNTTLKNANLTGEITAGDQLLVYDCQIVNNFENFNGIMDNVAFGQSSEVSFDTWATILKGTAGGDVTNEPEFSIGTASINISQWTGNLKLKNKTGSNRTVINCNSGNIIIDSTCVSGSIQLLGIGSIEQDNSGPNCNVDTVAFISRESISESVWDEPLVNHVDDKTTGYALMYKAYNGKIFVDPINGTNGSVYPYGIRQHPVKNITDVLNIYNNYNLSTVHILGSLVVSGGEDLSGFTFTSDRSIGNSLNIVNAITADTYFDNLTVSGTGNGRVRFTYCVIDGFTDLDGGIKNSLIVDDVNFTGVGNNYMTDVDTFTVSAGQYVSLDIGTTLVNMIRCHGSYQIDNKTGSNQMLIGMTSGDIKISNTCTAGDIHIDGICGFIDESAVGCNVNDDHRLSPDNIADFTWDEQLADHTTDGSFGGELATKADIAAASSTDSSFAISGSVIFGTEDSGTYVSTNVKDNTYWEIEEDSIDGLTTELTFNIPDNNRAGVFRVFGRYEGTPGSTHYIELWAYNYEASAWEQLLEEFLPGGNTTDDEYDHEYFERNIDRANNNEVKFRLIHNVTTYNSSHHMFLDFAEATSIDVITAEDIADAVWDEDTNTHSISGSFGILTRQMAGLLHSNIFIDNPVYDSAFNLIGGRVRIYSNSTSVGTNNDIIGTYQITSNTNNVPGKFITWSQQEVVS